MTLFQTKNSRIIKRIFIVLILCMASTCLKAQYTAISGGPGISPAFNYVYVGSLLFDPNSSANSQKLQIDVIGKGWFYDSKGTTTFYIANRSGLSVNQVTTGGLSFSKDVLKAYKNGNNTDFYLAINSAADYYTFAVKAYSFGFAISAGPVTIATQTATPAGTDISSTLNINPVFITDADGNIGMNTSSPDPNYKLSVNGKIRAKEIKVETGWADYVFNNDYPLLSLNQVKTYIDRYHHLPEVPSAAEVEKNGVNLGETNSLLLKKVEELTLYLIEQKQEIDKLKKQVSKLNSK